MATEQGVRAPAFELGRVYDRWTEINEPFGGSRQSGIARSASTKAIFIFTGETGAQYGYVDSFDDAGVFSYTGEGQVGDMTMTKGNLSIATHASRGESLHLFRSLGKGKGQRYLGEFAYANHSFRAGPDKNGNAREVIVFHLVPVSLLDEEDLRTADDADATSIAPLGLDEARRRALASFSGEEGDAGRDARRTLYRRSKSVRDYVLLRSRGLCEACGQPAPFQRPDGTPYLEPHHTTRVSDGGLDHPRFVGALCPTCHRLIHHGRDGARLNSRLQGYLSTIEPGA